MENRLSKGLLNPLLADHGVLLSALLDLVQGVVYFKDLQGRFVLINRAMAKALKVGSPGGLSANRILIFSP